MADLDDLELQVERTEAVEAEAASIIANTPPPLDEVRLQELIDRLDASAQALEATFPIGARRAAPARAVRRNAAALRKFIKR